MGNLVELTTTAQQQMQNVTVGFTTLQGFELAQRAAKALSQSTLVPKEYQNNLPNCIVALNMAQRLNADPLMVMQNLVIVHGRPTWSAQFMISTVNACGNFSALRYEWRGKEDTDTWACRAWAVEKCTEERLDGTWVSIGMAKKEGWYQKNGSKWQTMPQQMLMYRAGSWWARAYAPELSMGLTSAEEAMDIIDVTPEKPQTLAEVVQPRSASVSGSVHPETGEVTATATREDPNSGQQDLRAHHDAPPVQESAPKPLSLATLIKRLKAASSMDALQDIMTLPDVEALTAEEAADLTVIYDQRYDALSVQP